MNLFQHWIYLHTINMYSLLYSWPLNNVGIWDTNPLHSRKSECNFSPPPNLTLNSLLLTRRLTEKNKILINTYFVCYMYYILYSYNKVIYKKETLKIITGKRKCIYSTVLYQYCTFTSSVYKMNNLSALRSILSYMIQNIVNVIHFTNSRHQKWKVNVKKKFIFIYRYNDSCTDNKEAAIGLLYGSLV